jgi:type IV secretion system protein TrbD
MSAEMLPGFIVPVHRALAEPILLAGAPRSVAIANGTIAAAIALGLRLWLAGLILWGIGHLLSVWAEPSKVPAGRSTVGMRAEGARHDAQFVAVTLRHLKYPSHLSA